MSLQVGVTHISSCHCTGNRWLKLHSTLLFSEQSAELNSMQGSVRHLNAAISLTDNTNPQEMKMPSISKVQLLHSLWIPSPCWNITQGHTFPLFTPCYPWKEIHAEEMKKVGTSVCMLEESEITFLAAASPLWNESVALPYLAEVSWGQNFNIWMHCNGDS